MPFARKVEMRPHDTKWLATAHEEAAAIAAAFGSTIVTVHHIGSTAVPGLSARPIVDLLSVATEISKIDCHSADIERLGFHRCVGRSAPTERFFVKGDPDAGDTLISLHCVEQHSTEILRCLAFRDYLRANPDIAEQYGYVKNFCQLENPEDCSGYSKCKEAWIGIATAAAIKWLRAD